VQARLGHFVGVREHGLYCFVVLLDPFQLAVRVLKEVFGGDVVHVRLQKGLEELAVRLIPDVSSPDPPKKKEKKRKKEKKKNAPDCAYELRTTAPVQYCTRAGGKLSPGVTPSPFKFLVPSVHTTLTIPS